MSHHHFHPQHLHPATQMTSHRRTTCSTPGASSYSSLSFQDYIDADGHRRASRRTTTGPWTGRPRTAVSTLGYTESRQIVCAISESRGVSPAVGMAFVDLETSQTIICQICDSQTYVRTVQKLHVYKPSQILIMNTALQPKSQLVSIIEENLDEFHCTPVVLDRRYWSENAGLDYIRNLAFVEDVETIKIAIAGSHYAVCCLAAALKYIEGEANQTFTLHSLRMKYEPSQGSMMIDVSTVCSLELIQNIRDPKSKECLFGLLNLTQSAMGARLLRSNILQPLTNAETLDVRYDALTELTTKEEMVFGVRQALTSILDADRLLTLLIMVPLRASLESIAQDVNNVIMLRDFTNSIKPVCEALAGARTGLLAEIRDLCSPRNINPIQNLIDGVINEDIKYSKTPLDLRNQRVFAIKAGVNGLLDVTRQTFKENSEDIIAYVTELGTIHDLPLELKYDDTRQYYIRIAQKELEERTGILPVEFVNVVKKKKMVDFSTLELLKRNQKIRESHQETMLLSNLIISELIIEVRNHASILFRVSESIAMLDMLSGFAQLAKVQDYVRPRLSDTLGIKSGRHPIKEKFLSPKFIPNDIFASQQSRFQIITGCNMSGKSTYIRSVALMIVMAQIGSFLPAEYAALPIHQQLFARVSVDDSVTSNVSTFAAEMQEAAFILRNIDRHSIVIIDELGRGTSTRDGLAIAIAIAEALVDSHALVWFATHFVDLVKILSERNGVISLHLAVETPDPSTLNMLYKLTPGATTTSSYGLRLARVFPLPADVLAHAELVSSTLRENFGKQRRVSRAAMVQKRRKLILNVKEHLVQAHRGNMGGETLREWLEMLRKGFVERMVQLDAESKDPEDSSENNEEREDDEEDDDVIGARKEGSTGSRGERDSESDEDICSVGTDGGDLGDDGRATTAHTTVSTDVASSVMLID